MGKCWSFHLRHDVRAVVFGRSRTDTEASGNHLVHVAIDEQGEDFPLTRRQPCKASFGLITLGGLLRNRATTRECLIENLKQGFWIKWLLDEMQGAGAHGLDSHWHARLSRHNDERGLNHSAC